MAQFISENVCLCSFLGIIWSHLLHLSLQAFWVYFSVWWEDLTSSIYVWLFNFPNTTCWRDCLFFPCIFLPSLSKIDCRCVGLPLGSLFCSIDMSVFVLFWLMEPCSIVWSLGGYASSFVLFPQDCFGNSVSSMFSH